MKRILLIILGITILFTLQSNVTLADGGFGISNWVAGINVPKTDDPDTNDKAIYIITDVANRILSLLSVVAIIIFMIGGYKVLTAGGDDSKVKGGYKIIKNAIIGLLIIGLTWAMIRLIFWFIGGVVGEHSFDENS